MDLSQLGEFGLIARFQSHLKYHSPKLKIGIGDDCAVYHFSADKYLLATTDSLVEDVHFQLKFITPKQLGRKALVVNISDVAAMGGTPKLALVSLGIPKNLSVGFLDDFYKGINQICRDYQIELCGGDTVASPKHLMVNITLLGEVKKNRLFARSGARPGDKILVTGTLGDSALGLKLLTNRRKKWAGSLKARKWLIQKHLEPAPRIREALKLSRSNLRVTSMIDISDGLIQDLHHICQAGKVGARIDENRLPLSSALEQTARANHLKHNKLALSGGEDYELLFTLNPHDVNKLIRQFTNSFSPLTMIGEIQSRSSGITLVRKNGRNETITEPMGFNHFKINSPNK